MRKFDNFELQRRVDEVLYYVWDPIGVSDEPYARYEYEGYVAGILHTLENNNSFQPISDHLASIVTSSMGLSPNREKCNYAAKLLIEHKEAIKEGFA
jgi:hypothetical protein